MILTLFIVIPIVAGLLAWSVRNNGDLSRWIALGGNLAMLAVGLGLWWSYGLGGDSIADSTWLINYEQPWIPELGIAFRLGMDGISLLMVVLTAFLGVVSVMISWREIQHRVPFFHFNLMFVLAGINGVFLSLDLFLFYFFWEVMLVPMYFLIGIWGHERRVYAATKFFLFTQLSGLLMLVSILALYFAHHGFTGTYSFSYFDLLMTPLSLDAARWIMLGFVIAFAVKLPAVPLHTWLADAHTEAPTAGSVILAGLLLKTGAYGLIRFVLPMFPEAAHEIAPIAMLIGVIGILYGAILAFGQIDLKRLIAYTSVSHLGFVILGIFAFNEQGMQGAVMEMVCHGLSTGGLFILVGALQKLIHTRDMRRMGGMWQTAPRMGGIAMFFAIASLGLPGLGNFVGEFLVLVGAFQASITLTVLATLGLVAATAYSLWIIQQVFHGKPRETGTFSDLAPRYTVPLGAMILVLVWLGVYPRPVLDTARDAVHAIQRSTQLTHDTSEQQKKFVATDDMSESKESAR